MYTTSCRTQFHEPAEINDSQDLSGVRAGAHDEIFQKGKPVLVGADTRSTFCYLLSMESQCDGDTWGVHLLDLRKRGLNPDSFVGDAGSPMRAGFAAAFPNSGIPFRSDVFHTCFKLFKKLRHGPGKQGLPSGEPLQ